ncbi:unnamed protein product [Rotaria sp. Silwood1]|nr:unnamed protein product [Rotaria sp. Silwood1]
MSKLVEYIKNEYSTLAQENHVNEIVIQFAALAHLLLAAGEVAGVIGSAISGKPDQFFHSLYGYDRNIDKHDARAIICQ